MVNGSEAQFWERDTAGVPEPTQEELQEADARGHEASFIGGAHAARPNTPVGR